MYDTLRFEVLEPGIASVTLNRPERLNALSFESVEELESVFSELRRRPDLRVVVLTGAGRGFCSGFDLSEGDTLAPEFVKTIEAFTKPRKETDRNLDKR